MTASFFKSFTYLRAATAAITVAMAVTIPASASAYAADEPTCVDIVHVPGAPVLENQVNIVNLEIHPLFARDYFASKGMMDPATHQPAVPLTPEEHAQAMALLMTMFNTHPFRSVDKEIKKNKNVQLAIDLGDVFGGVHPTWWAHQKLELEFSYSDTDGSYKLADTPAVLNPNDERVRLFKNQNPLYPDLSGLKVKQLTWKNQIDRQPGFPKFLGTEGPKPLETLINSNTGLDREQTLVIPAFFGGSLAKEFRERTNRIAEIENDALRNKMAEASDPSKRLRQLGLAFASDLIVGANKVPTKFPQWFLRGVTKTVIIFAVTSSLLGVHANDVVSNFQSSIARAYHVKDQLSNAKASESIVTSDGKAALSRLIDAQEMNQLITKQKTPATITPPTESQIASHYFLEMSKLRGESNLPVKQAIVPNFQGSGTTVSLVYFADSHKILVASFQDQQTDTNPNSYIVLTKKLSPKSYARAETLLGLGAAK